MNSWDRPQVSMGYDIIIKLFDVNIDVVSEWFSMTDSDKMEYLIDLLVPIFKEEKRAKEQKYIDSIKSEETEVDNLQTNIKFAYKNLISDWKKKQRKLNLNDVPGQGTRKRFMKQATNTI